MVTTESSPSTTVDPTASCLIPFSASNELSKSLFSPRVPGALFVSLKMATTGVAGTDSTPPAAADPPKDEADPPKDEPDPSKNEPDPPKDDDTCSTVEAAPNCPAPYELSGSEVRPVLLKNTPASMLMAEQSTKAETTYESS
uniref:Uncharacterized protein n=1 Tax=Lepeophtheirus salmonis TaxID=72036 RepID=A0A0K2TI15_LEPSM